VYVCNSVLNSNNANVSGNYSRENQKSVSCSVPFFFRKSCFLDNLEIYGTASLASNDIRRMRIGQLRLQTHARNMYKFLFFHCKNCYANASHCTRNFRYFCRSNIIFEIRGLMDEVACMGNRQWMHAAIKSACVAFCIVHWSRCSVVALSNLYCACDVQIK
jgi:hypothetical protein